MATLNLEYILKTDLWSATEAYGDAAAVLLEMAQRTMPKLCALVAYYPPRIPAPAAEYPPNLNVIVHLTGSAPFAPRFKHYVYPDTQPGFAEVDLGVYDKIASGLAWSRTLEVVRRGFGIHVDVESVWENHLNGKEDAAQVMMTPQLTGYIKWNS